MGGVRRGDVRFEYGLVVWRGEMEEGTIYLDGVVQGPVIDNERRSFSFDHHGDCVRLATLSTCEQVWVALKLGLDPQGLKVVLNDLDADASVALWLLRHPGRIGEERVVEVVRRVGFVDSHGPVEEPLRLHRALSHFGEDEQTLEILWADQGLIDKWYEEGDGALPEPGERRRVFAFGVDREGEVRDFEAVEGFAELYEAGVLAAVVCPEGAEGTVGYTVGKRSEFVSFDVAGFLAKMNELEPGWGGGSTIGGAPRGEGGRRSELSVEQVRGVFERVVRQKQECGEV